MSVNVYLAIKTKRIKKTIDNNGIYMPAKYGYCSRNEHHGVRDGQRLKILFIIKSKKWTRVHHMVCRMDNR